MLILLLIILLVSALKIVPRQVNGVPWDLQAKLATAFLLLLRVISIVFIVIYETNIVMPSWDTKGFIINIERITLTTLVFSVFTFVFIIKDAITNEDSNKELFLPSSFNINTEL